MSVLIEGEARPTFNAAGGISFDDEHLEFLLTDAEAACAKLGSVEMEKKKKNKNDRYLH